MIGYDVGTCKVRATGDETDQRSAGGSELRPHAVVRACGGRRW